MREPGPGARAALRVVLAASLVAGPGPLAWAQTIAAQPLAPPAGSSLGSAQGTAAAPDSALPRPAIRHHTRERHAHKTAHAETAVTAGAAKKPEKAPETVHAAGTHVAGAHVAGAHLAGAHGAATHGAATHGAAKSAKAAAPSPAAQQAKAAVPPPPRPDPTKGTSTGLKLPRWVSFRSDEVNMRSGPGTQYPIQWVYHRRDYPVQILREFDVWRLIQTQDGTKGWVHQATLTGRRGFVVDGPTQVLRASAADTADPVAQLMPGVVGLLRRCPAGLDWCEVQAGGYKGWLKREATYGVFPSEVVG